MRITDKRINNLIHSFFVTLHEQGMDDISEHLRFPGGIVWVTKKQVGKDHEHAAAYTQKIQEHNSTAEPSDIPVFKIILVKESVLVLTDEEFLHLLAHEVSHILFRSRKNQLEEDACDTLAEFFWGFPKPKGSTLGYVHDKTALKKTGLS